MGLQAQLVRPLVDLLRLIAIEPIGGIPVRVLLRKPSRLRAVIPRAEVVRAGLFVKILPAVAEERAGRRPSLPLILLYCAVGSFSCVTSVGPGAICSNT